MKLRAMFSSREQAEGALRSINKKMLHGDGTLFQSMSAFEAAVTTIGGVPITHGHHHHAVSALGRELFFHQRQAHILQQDLEYLSQRDGIAGTIMRKVPRDVWFRPPRSEDPIVDEFIAALRRLRFFARARQAHTHVRSHIPAYAFILINAGGDISQHISEGGRRWTGFQVITHNDIDWDKTERNLADADLRDVFGIERLALTQQDGTTFFVHGSRIIPLYEDPVVDLEPRAALPLVLSVFDDLWDARDYRFMLRAAITDGDPYVIEVDTDAMAAGHTIDDDEATQMQQEVTDVRSGAQDSFGPLENTTIKRVGGVDLPDPEWGIRSSIGTIAAELEPTANMLMVFSRGSEQVTDQDRNDYQDNINITRDTLAWDALDLTFRRAKQSGFLGQVAPTRSNARELRDVEFPMELEWPFIRWLPERERAFVDARDATTVRELQDTGRDASPRILRKFPESDSPPPAARNGRRDIGTPQNGRPGLDSDRGSRRRAFANVLEDVEWKEYQEDIRGEPDPERRKKDEGPRSASSGL